MERRRCRIGAMQRREAQVDICNQQINSTRTTSLNVRCALVSVRLNERLRACRQVAQLAQKALAYDRRPTACCHSEGTHCNARRHPHQLTTTCMAYNQIGVAVTYPCLRMTRYRPCCSRVSTNACGRALISSVRAVSSDTDRADD